MLMLESRGKPRGVRVVDVHCTAVTLPLTLGEIDLTQLDPSYEADDEDDSNGHPKSGMR